jgi:AcrR family transcriptional regulator
LTCPSGGRRLTGNRDWCTPLKFDRDHPTLATEPETTLSKGEQTRQQIVPVAARLFAERGFRDANLDRIVAELRLTKGILYHSFPTKDKLAEVVVDLYGSRLKALNYQIRAACPNSLDAVVEMSYAAARLTHTDPVIRGGTRLLLERDMIDAPLPLPFAGWVERVTSIMREGQVRGEVVGDADPGEIAETIVEIFHGTQLVSHQMGDFRRFQRRLRRSWVTLLPVLRAPTDSRLGAR